MDFQTTQTEDAEYEEEPCVCAANLLRAQRDLGVELSAHHGLAETLSICLSAAIRLSELDCGGIYLIDNATGAVNLVSHQGLPDAFIAKTSHYTADTPQAQLVMAGRPIYTSYAQVDVPKDMVKYQEELRAIAVLPIAHKGRPIACLNIASHTFETVPESSRTVLETIAVQIGAAIAHAKAETALQQSQENLQTLFNSLEEFLFVLDTQGVIIQVNPTVCRRLGYAETELVGNSILMIPPPEQREAAAALVADILAGKTEVCTIPLQTRNGDLIPVETHITRGRWNNQEALFSVSRDIIERLKAEREIQRRTTQLETLRQIGLELTAQLDLKTLLHSMTLHAVRLLEAQRGGFFLYRPDLDALEWVAAIGFENPMIGSTLRRGEGLSGKVWETGMPLVVDDYHQWAGRSTQYDQVAGHALIGVPVQWGGEILGVLAISTNSPRTFSTTDAELLNLLTTQAAIAIRNANLLQAERGQRALAEALVKATTAVTSALEPDLVLDRILEEVERMVEGDACNIMLVAPPGMAHIARWHEYTHSYADIVRQTFPLEHYPTLQYMLSTGEPLVIADTRTHPLWQKHQELSWQRAYVGAPIRIGNEIVGFLNVDSARAGAFDATHAQWLRAFAGQSAVAIEHARLYDGLRSYTDVLEQRVQERTAEREAQYARLEAILSSVADGIIVADWEGNILQANPVAQGWLQHSLSLADVARLQQAIQELVHEAGVTQPSGARLAAIVVELKGLDLELRATPVEETGNVVIDLHDITPLRTLDRMKTRFITDISHELRTPVTTIQLYAHLLQQFPARINLYLEKIIREADLQAQLVQDIQEISHFDAGRVEIHPKQTPLNALLAAIVEKHARLAQERGLTLTYHQTELAPAALVDPQRLEQVLDNMLLNAIHYTPRGGAIQVDVGVQKDADRDWATIVVTDTGIGIPADELPHIFERFYRGKAPQLLHPGAGLGLSIVKEIIELHGGHVTVQSPTAAAPPEHPGAAFTLWLPFAT